MKAIFKIRWVLGLILGVATGAMVYGQDVVTIAPDQIAATQVAAGRARDVLPATGALVHLQLHDVMGVVEAFEDILVSGVPEKLLPMEAQELVRSEHPLLTLVGLQAFQQPLTPELFAQITGMDPRGSATVTLYLGDPRRMFIVSVPARSREPLANLLSGVLRPTVVEETELSGQSRVARGVAAAPLCSGAVSGRVRGDALCVWGSESGDRVV
jgi:hypothetical protein